MKNLRIKEMSKKSKIKKEITLFVKAIMHGLIIPTFIAYIAYVNNCELLHALFSGMIYMLLPAWIYHEKKRPEPAGFYIFVLIYFYMMFILWAEQGGSNVL